MVERIPFPFVNVGGSRVVVEYLKPGRVPSDGVICRRRIERSFVFCGDSEPDEGGKICCADFSVETLKPLDDEELAVVLEEAGWKKVDGLWVCPDHSSSRKKRGCSRAKKRRSGKEC